MFVYVCLGTELGLVIKPNSGGLEPRWTSELNIAIFSSLVHLGSKPPLLGLITRPNSVPRHTYTNIIESKFYTINHVSDNIIERAHMTSAKFNRDESEFEKCDLEKEYIDDFHAPYVKKSE